MRKNNSILYYFRTVLAFLYIGTLWFSHCYLWVKIRTRIYNQRTKQKKKNNNIMSPEHISIREFIYPPTYSENNVQTVFLSPPPPPAYWHYIIYSQNLLVDLLLLGAIMNVSWFMGRPPANANIVMSIIHIPFAHTHTYYTC